MPFSWKIYSMCVPSCTAASVNINSFSPEARKPEDWDSTLWCWRCKIKLPGQWNGDWFCGFTDCFRLFLYGDVLFHSPVVAVCVWELFLYYNIDADKTAAGCVWRDCRSGVKSPHVGKLPLLRCPWPRLESPLHLASEPPLLNLILTPGWGSESEKEQTVEGFLISWTNNTHVNDFGLKTEACNGCNFTVEVLVLHQTHEELSWNREMWNISLIKLFNSTSLFPAARHSDARQLTRQDDDCTYSCPLWEAGCGFSF